MGTFTKLTYHVVFSTKYRKPSITDRVRGRLYEYIGGIVRNSNGNLIEIGGIDDHVHLLVNLSPARSVSETIRDIKANSSKWANELAEVVSRFEWQKGYGAFTVSHSQIELVRRYIRNQREHHRKESFQDEYVELLRRHELQFDDDFLFEAEHQG